MIFQKGHYLAEKRRNAFLVSVEKSSPPYRPVALIAESIFFKVFASSSFFNLLSYGEDSIKFELTDEVEW